MEIALVEINQGLVALYKTRPSSCNLELDYHQSIKNNKNIKKILTDYEILQYLRAVEFCLNRLSKEVDLRVLIRREFTTIDGSRLKGVIERNLHIHALLIGINFEKYILSKNLLMKSINLWYEEERIDLGYFNRYGRFIYSHYKPFKKTGSNFDEDAYNELLLNEFRDDIDEVNFYTSPNINHIDIVNDHLKLVGNYFRNVKIQTADISFVNLYKLHIGNGFERIMV